MASSTKIMNSAETFRGVLVGTLQAMEVDRRLQTRDHLITTRVSVPDNGWLGVGSEYYKGTHDIARPAVVIIGGNGVTEEMTKEVMQAKIDQLEREVVTLNQKLGSRPRRQVRLPAKG